MVIVLTYLKVEICSFFNFFFHAINPIRRAPVTTASTISNMPKLVIALTYLKVEICSVFFQTITLVALINIKWFVFSTFPDSTFRNYRNFSRILHELKLKLSQRSSLPLLQSADSNMLDPSQVQTQIRILANSYLIRTSDRIESRILLESVF